MVDDPKITVTHNLDEVAKEFDDFLEKYSNKKIPFIVTPVVDDVNIKGYRPPPGFGYTKPTRPDGAPGARGPSSTERDLDKRYKNEHLKFMREELKNMNFLRSAGGAALAPTKGLWGLGHGGGLSGVFSGIETGIDKAMKAGGGFSSLLMGMSIGRAARATKAVAAEEGAAEGASVAEGAAAGGGIATLGKLLPFPVKVIGVAAGALGGAAFLSELASKDLVARNRRAQGFGANLGELTAFDKTMSRYVNPDNVMAAMRDAKYDVSSSAYTAMRIAGINPKDWTSPTNMGEAALITVQNKLKELGGPGGRNEGTLLTRAHATGLGNLGLSDEDLIRLYQAPKGDVAQLARTARGREKSLDVDQDTIKANQDYVTKLGLMEAEWLKLSEVLNTETIPGFRAVADKLDNFAHKENLRPDESIGTVLEDAATNAIDTVAKGVADFLDSFKKANTIPKGPVSDADLPSIGASAVSFEDMADRLDSRGKNMPVEDKALLDWMKTTFGVDGAVLGGGDAGGAASSGGSGSRRSSSGGRGRGRTASGGRAGGGGATPGDIKFTGGGRIGTGEKEPGLYATNVGTIASKGFSPEEAAFLDTLATGETPRGSYSNRSGDPGGLGGRYQFLLSTWNKEATKAGVNPKDFSPENQDKVALFYAKEIVKQKTGNDLFSLLRSGSNGVRTAIAALSPGIWNAITNIDRDKRGHSGAIALYMRKLLEESKQLKTANAAPPDSYKPSGVPKANIHLPNVYDGRESSEYPSPTEKAHLPPELGRFSRPSRPVTQTPAVGAQPGSSAMLHLNDTRNFQSDKGMRVHVSNPAGADVHVSSGQLGFTSGGYS